MAKAKLPDGAITTPCPMGDCSGAVSVELLISAAQQDESDTFTVSVKPNGFKLVGEHNHEDPWMEVPG